MWPSPTYTLNNQGPVLFIAHLRLAKWPPRATHGQLLPQRRGHALHSSRGSRGRGPQLSGGSNLHQEKDMSISKSQHICVSGSNLRIHSPPKPEFRSFCGNYPFKISRKNTPETTWRVVFWGLDFNGWDMSTIHATLTPGGDWEINVKHSWRNPQFFFYEATAMWETNVENSWGTLQRTFWEVKAIFCKKCQKTNVSFCPKTLKLWLKTPKLTLLGKNAKKLKELGGKCKEVMGEPPAEPVRKRKGSAQEDQRDHETGATFVKPWWNLLQNFLAAPDGSAPENQRHHETWRTLMKPWWNLGGTLAEPYAEPFGSPRRICPREP